VKNCVSAENVRTCGSVSIN